MANLNVGGGVIDTALLGAWTQVGDHIYDATISSATMLTPAAGATGIILIAQDAALYFTVNNSTPSASNGFLLTPEMGAVQVRLQGSNPIKVIEADSGAIVRGAWIS